MKHHSNLSKKPNTTTFPPLIASFFNLSFNFLISSLNLSLFFHMRLQSQQSVMATSRFHHPLSFKLAITVVFIFFFTFLPPKSVGSWISTRKGIKESKLVTGNNGEEYYDYKVESEKKMVVGSRPPGCKNKCLNCRPCMATLVVPIHRMKNGHFKAVSSSSHGEDDSYYLLSWKCRCGNQIYQP